MSYAYPLQRFQDWLTQQWVILWGRKISLEKDSWLMGPFGSLEGLGKDFVDKLAQSEQLLVDRETVSQGLIPSMELLHIPKSDFVNLSQEVIDFYEKTADYTLCFSVKWNPFFKIFGNLVNILFSRRLDQLHIPVQNYSDSEAIESEIFTLIDPKSNEKKYTFWFRTIKSTGQVIYSGLYGLCTMPNGRVCVKAVFPLPNGNATVIMTPRIGSNGDLILDSSGNKFGDSGFYFLVKDAKGAYWSKYIRSFRDRLCIGPTENGLSAKQSLTLWHLNVLKFDYQIR